MDIMATMEAEFNESEGDARGEAGLGRLSSKAMSELEGGPLKAGCSWGPLLADVALTAE